VVRCEMKGDGQALTGYWFRCLGRGDETVKLDSLDFGYSDSVHRGRLVWPLLVIWVSALRKDSTLSLYLVPR
jgi:hypothetical protein